MGNYRLGMEYNEGFGTYLAHHGIKGQKWGVRRFQNPDGTWTEAGKERYGASKTNNGTIKVFTESSKLVWQMTKNKKVMKQVRSVLKDGSALSNRIDLATIQYDKATKKLDDAFVEYDERYSHEHGRFTGDGTEAHWTFMDIYPEYKLIAEKQKKAEKEWYMSLMTASKAGKFDFIDIPDYGDRYGTNYAHIDNKAAVVAGCIALDKGVNYFYENFEILTFRENGVKKNYWQMYDTYIYS